MKIFKAITIGVVTLILAACASAPNPLSVEDRDQYFVKNTKVTWNLPEKEQAVEVKKDANDEGKRAEGRKLIAEKLTSIVSQEFTNSPSGPTAIDFNIAIKRYDRVGAAVGNIIGGSDMVIADVIVTENATGKEIAVYEDIAGIKPSGGGILGAVIQAAAKPDVEGLMAVSFSEKLRKRFDKKKKKQN